MIHIKVVGVCGSGKTTLVNQLQALGFEARQVSQEHSGVPDLWQRRNPPDLLIYLEVSGSVARSRYPHLNLTDDYLAKERRRLDHARTHADCTILTDSLDPGQVLAQALACIRALGFELD